MSLFASSAVKKTKPTGPQADYSAKDIEVLEGLEPVRRRPGMYIGGTDEKAMHHLVSEVLDNAMDEAVAGFASTIDIHVDTGNRITISDNGRGIPIDPHPKFPDKSALEVILTTLHSGGKFDSKVYDTSGGLHGVGVSVVNALTDDLKICVYKNKATYTQSYSKGHVQTKLEMDPTPTRKKGTRIRFHPDPEIFGDLQFKPQIIYNLAKSKAYLFKGVHINWQCDKALLSENSPIPQKEKLFFPDGLLDFLKRDTQRTGDDAAENEITYFAADAKFSDGKGRVEWAIAYDFDQRSNQDAQIITFCNTIPTPLGGTHETGFKAALLKGLRDYGDRIGNKKISQITHEDIAQVTRCVVSCFIQQPQFQGQTKEKLVSAHASRLVENSVKDHFDQWLAGNANFSNTLVEKIIEHAEDRLKRRQAKEISRASATKRLRLPGKLADCTSTKANESEIFIVEGDSAGGSAKQARARATQAVLPLRGKILNVATATMDKLNANQQIKDLILALGCGIGNECDLKKLRYHKIIIMTDADVDGAHIASLILTFFFQEMRSLLEAGHVYLAMPPLYRIAHNGLVAYAKDDAEKDQLLKTTFRKYTKVDISRFKGLGEMPMEQLRATTMDATKRNLQKVALSADDQNVGGFVNRLMGKNADARFRFIQENASFVEDLDI